MVFKWIGISQIDQDLHRYVAFLKQRYPQIFHLNGISHYKPSISGYPIYGNHISSALDPPIQRSPGRNVHVGFPVMEEARWFGVPLCYR